MTSLSSLLQALGPSGLVVLGGIVTWLLKARVEELRALEERLQEERRAIYREILEPYVRIFSDPKGHGKSQALRKITSFEYKKTAFDLNLFGSDDVVRAYNALMQHAYKTEDKEDQEPKEMLRLWGGLILAIRKNLGNKKTKLEEIDMLKGMIKDIDSVL